MSDDFLKEIQDAFLGEAEDHLRMAEQLFLRIEADPSDKEGYQELARLAHNFKGSGKAVGFDHISHFSHELENLLIALKEGRVAPTAQTFDLLLRCSDRLRSDIEALKANPGAELEHVELIGQLQSALSGPAKSEEAMPSALEASVSEPGTAGHLEAAEPFQETLTEAKNTSPTQAAVARQAEEYVRVPLKKLEVLLNLFSEQVILQSALDQVRDTLADNQEIAARTISQLSKLTNDLQQSTMALRMVSLGQLFSKLERAVRDATRQVDKKIRFETKGQETEIDKSMVDALGDALTHMVRNSVDHGIESGEERLTSGKADMGLIRVNAYRSGGSFVLEISDDGKGLDHEKIHQKALKQGLVKDGDRLSKDQVFQLIFANGFSTKDVATDLSGRGVGMNVVKETVQAMKGSLEIESELGRGTLFRIRLPLTLSIFNGFRVRVGSENYIVPASDVEEVVRIQKKDIVLEGDRVPLIRIRDDVFAIEYLQSRFGSAAPTNQGAMAAILVRKGVSHPTALVVDEILTMQKIVHKALTPEARRFHGASGSTILGDGSVAMILDVKAFAHKTVTAA
jgi:two-component system chemotaxis sensor kinase CheA